MKTLRLTLQILLPLVVLLLGGLLAMAILGNKHRPIVRAPIDAGPLVRVMAVAQSNEQLDVVARGSVEPLRTVDLCAEVSGRIVATHAALRAGGAFTPNDVLVEIDANDYRLAITQQESAVARAELRLLQEEAEAASAVRAWRQLEGDRPADALVRRVPQIRDAQLAVAAAKAQLERSQLDLQRTKVTLPFTGRVRSVAADIGQTVQRGQRLAVVLDTSQLEVRLPIPLADTGFLDLPLQGRTDTGPEVVLTAEFAGQRHTWPARIVRTEGEINRRTRQLTVIARVSATIGEQASTPPLLVGMFVEARIVGRQVTNVVLVPRSAVQPEGHVWVVTNDPEQPAVGSNGAGDSNDSGPPPGPRLQRREVDVLRTGKHHVVLRTGLLPGELICLSNLEAPVDGMAVRIATTTEGK